MSSGVQPQTIMQPLFSSTKHLIYLFTVSVKLKRRCIADVLSHFWTFINICIYERKLWEIVTQLTEFREDLATNTAPER